MRILSALAILGLSVIAGLTGAPAAARTAQPPLYTFLSHPDFLNADVGDVSTLPTWDGVHNSWNQDYRRSLDVVLDQFAAERPDDILVAGDLVEGHWGVDRDATGIFGPVETTAEKLQAVENAGSFYYSAWKQRFLDHGLPLPHVTVGDHEVGDNPWSLDSFKYGAVPTFKQTFADYLMAGRYPLAHRPEGTAFAQTSYWTELHPQVMLVSVDLMRPMGSDVSSKYGALIADIGGSHLAWFRETLAYGKAHYKWVVVQGHTPAIGPVRVSGSSSMKVAKGGQSDFWLAMKQSEVDLYLCGEVHQVTAIDRGGPVQISHGGLFPFGNSRYLRVDVFKNRMEVASFGFEAHVGNREDDLWQTSGKRAVPPDLDYFPGRVQRGTATLTPQQSLVDRTGDLAPATALGNLS